MFSLPFDLNILHNKIHITEYSVYFYCIGSEKYSLRNYKVFICPFSFVENLCSETY
jgi:hypothetical protein